MPGTKLAEIQLDVLENQIICHSPKYYLNTFLPYKVNEKEGKAQWISDKSILQISVSKSIWRFTKETYFVILEQLPILRESLF